VQPSERISEPANTIRANTEENNAPEEKSATVENEDWRGDVRYFQTGKKQGQLKPSAAVDGIDAKKASMNFSGLKTDSLNPSVKPKNIAQPVAPDSTKPARMSKSEKREAEAKVGATVVMRCLDISAELISGGEYGANFSASERESRLSYREQLQNDWEIYLATVDLPLHPALVVIAGSVMYIAPAVTTDKGSAKISWLKNKIGGLFKRKTVQGAQS